MVLGGAVWMAELLVLFAIALVLASLSSRRQLPLNSAGASLRTPAAALCTLAVLAAMLLGTGVLVYQAGTIVNDSNKYYSAFADLLGCVGGGKLGDRRHWDEVIRRGADTLSGWAVSGVGGVLASRARPSSCWPRSST